MVHDALLVTDGCACVALARAFAHLCEDRVEREAGVLRRARQPIVPLRALVEQPTVLGPATTVVTWGRSDRTHMHMVNDVVLVGGRDVNDVRA